ncbi:PD-(D/E)XK nuclease family protein [Liquorilactobacillus oeni]|uniref:ATP-dependent helicase/deoxyribonuclease subunit B n=1 Tax=Liquorilactobacillus oeni DSM 19972 TaxID=1423777 RepID=A0A0R1MBI4_9LACO|nr:PD-(D/E)XK nuclease family protein [Liquorilactobacillus oeni]KRL05677.1 ATP-dependent helicase deoxyribonuclease subunit B [Liquorilactobacillus oeni DSM 19972]
MSLGFILGKASADHQKALAAQLVSLKKKDPQGKFYFLVPNHIKFASEVKVLHQLKALTKSEQTLFAENSVQIFSFSRLAWYFLSDTAFYQTPRISEAGRNMIIQDILQKHQDELTVFKSEQEQLGFVSQIRKQLDEFEKGCITSEDLVQFASKTPDQMDLRAKLHDLSLVYADYTQQTAGKYLDNNVLLEELANVLNEKDMEHSYFFIYGFTQFTASEFRLVTTLFKKSKLTLVSLVLDRAYTEQVPETHELFYRAGLLYFKLYQAAKKEKVPLLVDSYVKDKRVENPTLITLEDYWIASTRMSPLKEKHAAVKSGLQFFSADNRYHEVAEVATRLRQQVALHNYHYHDFAVLTRHLDLYRNIIGPVFKQFGIPYFIDLQKQMSDHPLVEFINALFAVHKRYYRYDDMMRLLKTELLLPQENGKDMPVSSFRDYLDVTENLVLRFGYEGKRWLQEDDWDYYRFSDADTGVHTEFEKEQTRKVNCIRHFVKKVLPPFFKKMEKAKTGREGAFTLCNFLVENGVVKRLYEWRDQELAAGHLTEATRPEETWDTFCQLLDEYVITLGETKFDNERFIELLQSGFEGAEYRQVPSTLDQVIISETGMVQMNDRKATFLIGATDTAMPDRVSLNDILSDEDRQFLEPVLSEDQFLNEESAKQLAAEPFLSYLAFMSSSTALFVSYPLSNDGEGMLHPSPYTERIRRYFELPLEHFGHEPLLEDKDTDILLHYTGTKRTTLSHLLSISRQARARYSELPSLWAKLYFELKNNPQSAFLTKKLFASLDYQNTPEKLRSETVELLYGDTINTSISKLEEFYTNEYAYFLKYGLKLQERDVFELSAANTGEFFHLALDSLVKVINQKGLDFAALSEESLDAQLKIITVQMLKLPQFQILNSSQRMNYLSRQLTKTVRQISWALRQQSVRSKMRPKHTEVLFGHVGAKTGLRPLQFELSGKRKVNVRGKIDRIDQIKTENEIYLGIVDYKSSAHNFDFRDAFYGVSLQMLTYLDALVKNLDLLSEDKMNISKPAGALYMHLYNPKLKMKSIVKQSKEDAWLKANKYDGLLVAEPQLLGQLDQELEQESSGHSKIFPFKKNKSGIFGSSSLQRHQLVTMNELLLLLQHNEELIRKAAEKIFAGELALNPVQWPDKRTALQYSPFKSIFQFDAMLPENNYRVLPQATPQDILATLKEKKGGSKDGKD